MEQTKFVQFKKERDLGAIITDSFQFLRYEWKPFFTTIIKISLIPIILAVLSIVFFSFSFSQIFDNAFYDNTTYQSSLDFTMVFTSLGLVMLFYLIAYVMITASAMYYIKSYIENNGTIDYNYISEMTKQKFWPFVGLFIMMFFIILVGALFCFLPAIYFGVVLSLASSILVFVDKNPVDAIGESFNVISGHWWETFGVILVVGILVGIMGYISQIPSTIYQLVKMGISVGQDDPTAVFSLFKDPIYLLLIGFSYIIRFLLYTITLITYAFIYFDINEQKNSSGSLELIDTIGKE